MLLKRMHVLAPVFTSHALVVKTKTTLTLNRPSVLEEEKRQRLAGESPSTGDTTARRREKCVCLTKALREQPACAQNQFHTLSPPRHCDVIHSSSSPSK